MLQLNLGCLVIALAAVSLGFGGIAGLFAGGGKIPVAAFLVLNVVLLIVHAVQRGRIGASHNSL